MNELGFQIISKALFEDFFIKQLVLFDGYDCVLVFNPMWYTWAGCLSILASVLAELLCGVEDAVNFIFLAIADV